MLRVTSRALMSMTLSVPATSAVTNTRLPSGETAAARGHIATLKAETPGLSFETARVPRFGDKAAGERFYALLRDSGL